MKTDEEPSYLDELIQASIDEDPGFADAWAPFEFVARLMDERARLGLSQRDVAGRMGVSPAVVARIENNPGSVSLARILAYAKAVGVSLVMKPSHASPLRAA